MTKQELRRIYLEQRKALTGPEVEALSESVCRLFFAGVDMKNIRVIHSFLPIRKNNEPNSWLIINELRKKYPSIKVSVPRVNHDTGLLDHVFLSDPDLLTENRWGIPEMDEGQESVIADLDIVLVPLLAFDLKGNRVGYGKGFYDRFLSECPPKTRRIGLSLFEAVDSIEDTNEFDVPLHNCISPVKVYSF